MAEVRPPAGDVGRMKEVDGRLVRLGEKDPIPIHASGFRIGRDPLSELVVAEPEVSRLHAEVRYEGGRYVLYDFSSNGTWVNGQLVTDRRTLRVGDVLKIGSHEYRFASHRLPEDVTTPPLPPPPPGTPVRPVAMAGATMQHDPRARSARPGFLYALLLALIGGAIYFFLLR